MIFAYTGKTGSGKTFLAVKQLYKYWKEGVDVYTNTPLLFMPEDLRRLEVRPDIDTFPTIFTRYERIKDFVTKLVTKVFKRPYNPVTRGKVIYFQDITDIIDVHDGVIFFDEAQSLFNAREWESLPAEFQYKLQQHRKHSLDLICTTQNMGTVDIAYRRLVQGWTHCECLFQLGKSPRILFGLFRENKKDIDMLYNQVDDLLVETIDTKTRIISLLSKALYDTMFDIGFKRFKILWINHYDKLMKAEKRYLIIPKRMKLSDALRAIRLYQSLLNPNKSPYSRRT